MITTCARTPLCIKNYSISSVTKIRTVESFDTLAKLFARPKLGKLQHASQKTQDLPAQGVAFSANQAVFSCTRHVLERLVFWEAQWKVDR